LIQIHFDDLCALVRDRHSDSAFASVEASGPARSREVVEKLLAHPLLDEGRALTESDAVLVSLVGGKDLTMAEVNRVMEQIGRHSEQAQIIMGAAVDETLKNRLSVTVIAAKQNAVAAKLPVADALEEPSEQEEISCGLGARPVRNLMQSPSLTMGQRESRVLSGQAGQPRSRTRKAGPKMLQTQLPLAIISKGRFDKSEPTIHKGEDLDIPTFVRRGVPLN
jgi:cell division protein FtsZ